MPLTWADLKWEESLSYIPASECTRVLFGYANVNLPTLILAWNTHFSPQPDSNPEFTFLLHIIIYSQTANCWVFLKHAKVLDKAGFSVTTPTLPLSTDFWVGGYHQPPYTATGKLLPNVGCCCSACKRVYSSFGRRPVNCLKVSLYFDSQHGWGKDKYWTNKNKWLNWIFGLWAVVWSRSVSLSAAFTVCSVWT